MKHVGTITDRSYYDTYWEIKGNTVYSKRICPHCEAVVEIGFEHLDTNGRGTGFAVALPHICKVFQDLNARGDYAFTAEHLRFIPRLEWGQFIFNPAI